MLGARPCMTAGGSTAAAAMAGRILRAALLVWSAAGVPEQRSTMEIDTCECKDPKGSGACYEPVCPPGYFKCCATCKEAPCFGTDKMYLSWRGIPECIECKPGDFCSGCDTYARCPDSTQPNREGPRISAAKSAGVGDCESCPKGLEASFDRSACMMKYTDVCNVDVVSRCIRNCKSADPSKGKRLEPCERMKCTMYCAGRWSEACRSAVSEYCVFSTTLAMDLPDGIEAEEGQGSIVGCDVDCNLAARMAPVTTLAMVVAAVIAIPQAF